MICNIRPEFEEEQAESNGSYNLEPLTKSGNDGDDK